MIKNLMSKRLFGMTYDRLPLASEIICDLRVQIMKYKICTLLLSAVFALLTVCTLMR